MTDRSAVEDQPPPRGAGGALFQISFRASRILLQPRHNSVGRATAL